MAAESLARRPMPCDVSTRGLRRKEPPRRRPSPITPAVTGQTHPALPAIQRPHDRRVYRGGGRGTGVGGGILGVRSGENREKESPTESQKRAQGSSATVQGERPSIAGTTGASAVGDRAGAG